MVLEGKLCQLRPYRSTDAPALVAIANDLEVVRYLTHRFPHPYTRSDAEEWLPTVVGAEAPTTFAIEVDRSLGGGIGLVLHEGEYAATAEMGFWLARPNWGRGIATEAVRVLVPYAFETLRLRRIEASVMAPNLPSARVLEKAGFVREAIRKQAFVGRDGAIYDGLLYRLLSTDAAKNDA